jgi:hypothetical protein
MRALAHLGVSNNNIGQLIGWKECDNWNRRPDLYKKYEHSDGRKQNELPAEGVGQKPDGIIALANGIKDMGAMTSLDISSNSIGICDDLPEGWTYGSNYSMCYRHKDGNQSFPPSGAKSSGVIAIANAIGDMGALLVLNLASNKLGPEAFIASTELYVAESLVRTSVAGWAPVPHQALPSDSLQVVSANPPLADRDITNASGVLGKVALVNRGGCSFVDKAQRLQAAGAIAMVCVNNDEDTPDEVSRMSDNGQRDVAAGITIPVVMVSFNTGMQIRALAAMSVTINRSLTLTDAIKDHT